MWCFENYLPKNSIIFLPKNTSKQNKDVNQCWCKIPIGIIARCKAFIQENLWLLNIDFTPSMIGAIICTVIIFNFLFCIYQMCRWRSFIVSERDRFNNMLGLHRNYYGGLCQFLVLGPYLKPSFEFIFWKSGSTSGLVIFNDTDYSKWGFAFISMMKRCPHGGTPIGWLEILVDNDVPWHLVDFTYPCLMSLQVTNI